MVDFIYRICDLNSNLDASQEAGKTIA